MGPTSLTFTSANWNVAQSVTVAGVDDDDLADESMAVTVSVSDGASDDDWDPLGDQTITTTVTDDDTAGFTLSTSTATATEGATGTVTVALTAQPASVVRLTLASADIGAVTAAAVHGALHLRKLEHPQTLTLTAVDDADTVDESVAVTVSVDDGASDDDWDPLADQTITTTVTDDDSPGFTLSPTSATVGEAGSINLTVVLDAQPVADVTIDVASGDSGAATVSPTSVTFTSVDWNTPQTVTATASTTPTWWMSL